MKSSSYFRYMVNLLSWFSLFVCLILILSGLNRGFDISDEGFYVMLTVPSQENEAGIINYDLFFKLFFKATGITFSLIDLRLMRLVGYLFAAVALTQFLKNRFEIAMSRQQLFILSTLGLFSGYAFLPPTLSYNSLSVVLGSFWLYCIFSHQSSDRKAIFLGLILAMLIYVKVTLALALLFLSLCIFAFGEKFSFRSVLILFIPILILEGLFWILIKDFALYRLSAAIPLTTSRSGYGFLSMLKSPFIGFVFTLVGLALGGFVAKAKAQGKGVFVFVVVAVMGFLVWMIRFTHITEEWNHALLLVTSIFLGFLQIHSKSDWSFSPEKITLFLFPFILHLGSNVYWLRIGIHYWIFWVVLIVICAGTYSDKLLTAVATISLILVFNGIWWHPFGQDKPLWAQKFEFDRGGELIKIDKELIDAANQIRAFAAARGLTKMYSAYRIPGLVWLTSLQIPNSSNFWDQVQLEKSVKVPPSELLFCPIYKLPDGWNYPNSQSLGPIQGNMVYLLHN
ncbi:MAG: hypothetical protein MUE75_09940 [Algoriphagus sp.]|nr:hypothetical protein [Algoriphagus sp.]